MSKFFQQESIILASGSAIRRKLLQSLGLTFEIKPSNYDEEKLKRSFANSGTMIELARQLAAAKALEVSQAYPEYFVIAADQLCVIGERYLDKPLSHEVAVSHLRLLRGQKHQQIAATCIARRGLVLWQHEDLATLNMHQLSDETIEAYLRSEQPYQSCGAYQYEGPAKWLFKAMEGSEDTILGLPLMPLSQALIELKAVSF